MVMYSAVRAGQKTGTGGRVVLTNNVLAAILFVGGASGAPFAFERESLIDVRSSQGGGSGGGAGADTTGMLFCNADITFNSKHASSYDHYI